MKAFISYSHADSLMLEMLHKHLAQLQREGLISTWTDNEILAGASLDQNISSALSNSKLFIALLSPDYIASNYCYEKEFQKALEMQEQGQSIIIPIIIEPCDWLNTPFKKFKALPKDGKAITTWENKNTAFLDVIQNIRILIEGPITPTTTQAEIKSPHISPTRNYRIKKDFDSIEKLEFVEKTFHEIKEYLKRYMEEIRQLDNIRVRVLIENNNEFQCLLVNRNKIAAEAQLTVSISSENINLSFIRSSEKQISYSIIQNNRPSNKSFTLAFDEYHLFWSVESFYSTQRSNKELTSKEIVDIMWGEWLESVGIL